MAAKSLNTNDVLRQSRDAANTTLTTNYFT